MIQLVSTYYYVYIYGPSIRKKPPTLIFIIPCSALPLVTTASHRPSQKDIRDGRIPYPPTVSGPPPPGSLRTLIRQKTLATAHYIIRTHLFIYPPPHPDPQGSRIHHLELPPSPPHPPGIRAGAQIRTVLRRRLQAGLEIRSSCRLYPSPPPTRKSSGRRSDRQDRVTAAGIPTEKLTGSVLSWPNNPSVHDGNPLMRTSDDAASTTGARRIGYPTIASNIVRSARPQQSDA